MLYKKIYLEEGNEQGPTMTSYIHEGKKDRPAIVICPGGGYHTTSYREAKPIALAFNAAGYHAFVIDYSVSPSRYPKSLIELSNAIDVIRTNAIEWYVKADQIAVCGFSAGGHLVASLGVYWRNIAKDYSLNNKPNLLILCYPVITSGEFIHKGSFDNLLGEDINLELLGEVSLENHVNDETPPTFLWHTVEDQVVPFENSMLFAKALRTNNIPFELHIYPYGQHGLSLATYHTAELKEQINNHVASWFDLCLGWIKNYFN